MERNILLTIEYDGSADTANFKAIYFSNQNGGAGTFWHRITGTWK